MFPLFSPANTLLGVPLVLFQYKDWLFKSFTSPVHETVPVVSDVSDPTLVKDDAVTPLASVDPVRAPAAAAGRPVNDAPDPVVVRRVPDVGRVTLVVPVLVRVTAFAPDVVQLPARDSVDPSVPANVKELDVVRVFPFEIVNVADVAGAVIVTLFKLVADATPIFGVTNDGEFPNDVRELVTIPEAKVDPVSADPAILADAYPKVVTFPDTDATAKT